MRESKGIRYSGSVREDGLLVRHTPIPSSHQCIIFIHTILSNFQCFLRIFFHTFFTMFLKLMFIPQYISVCSLH